MTSKIKCRFYRFYHVGARQRQGFVLCEEPSSSTSLRFVNDFDVVCIQVQSPWSLQVTGNQPNVLQVHISVLQRRTALGYEWRGRQCCITMDASTSTNESIASNKRRPKAEGPQDSSKSSSREAIHDKHEPNTHEPHIEGTNVSRRGVPPRTSSKQQRVKNKVSEHQKKDSIGARLASLSGPPLHQSGRYSSGGSVSTDPGVRMVKNRSDERVVFRSVSMHTRTEKLDIIERSDSQRQMGSARISAPDPDGKMAEDVRKATVATRIANQVVSDRLGKDTEGRRIKKLNHDQEGRDMPSRERKRGMGPTHDAAVISGNHTHDEELTSTSTHSAPSRGRSSRRFPEGLSSRSAHSRIPSEHRSDTTNSCSRQSTETNEKSATRGRSLSQSRRDASVSARSRSTSRRRRDNSRGPAKPMAEAVASSAIPRARNKPPVTKRTTGQKKSIYKAQTIEYDFDDGDDILLGRFKSDDERSSFDTCSVGGGGRISSPPPTRIHRRSHSMGHSSSLGYSGKKVLIDSKPKVNERAKGSTDSFVVAPSSEKKKTKQERHRKRSSSLSASTRKRDKGSCIQLGLDGSKDVENFEPVRQNSFARIGTSSDSPLGRAADADNFARHTRLEADADQGGSRTFLPSAIRGFFRRRPSLMIPPPQSSTSFPSFIKSLYPGKADSLNDRRVGPKEPIMNASVATQELSDRSTSQSSECAILQQIF